MSFFVRIILSALVPIALAIALFAVLLQRQSAFFEQRLTQALHEGLLSQRKQALADHTEIALAAISVIPDIQANPQRSHQEHTKNMLQAMGFGADGYFYAYTLDGVNEVHPIMPHLQGQNLIGWEDVHGNPLIQNLIKAAKAGTGFHSYTWHRPSTDSDEPKIGYVEEVTEWNWMIGTGLYYDDINQAVSALGAEIAAHFRGFERTWFLLMLGALVITSALLSLFRYREGLAANHRLRQLTNEVVHAQETERKRVSQELHDGIGQTLVGCLYGIESAQATPSKAGKILERAHGSIRDAIEEVRRISKGLRPAALDDLGLGQALNELARTMESNSGIEISVNVEPMEGLINRRQLTTLYRVAQEALSNAVQHSGADTISVKSSRSRYRIALEISDNGKGLDRTRSGKGKKGSSGLGLRGMQERVELHNGSFRIHSDPGKGTRLRIAFPVVDHADQEAPTSLFPQGLRQPKKVSSS